MNMYAKLFARITESSLMEESVNVRYVFIMMLAIADPKGVVIGTDIAISRRLNIPLGEFKSCAALLSAPDPESNSQKQEGRRLVPSDGERGYLIVNYATYRDIRDEEERREYMKTYMQRRRKGLKDEDVADVKPRKLRKLSLTKEETEVPVKEEAKPKEKQSTVPLPKDLNTPEFREAWTLFAQHRKEIKKPMTVIAAEMQIKDLAKMGLPRAIAAIHHSIKNGWQGIFEPDGNNALPPPQKPIAPAPDPERWIEYQKEMKYFKLHTWADATEGARLGFKDWLKEQK